MANKINGDFDQETIEAFRAAYAAQLQTPEDQEVDEYTRLPTNVVANTSPWIQHTGLWKANPGNLNDFVPNQVLSTPDVEEEEDLSEEEIDNLVNELLGELAEEEEEEEEEDFESLSQEIDSFLDHLQAEEDEDFENDVDVEEEELIENELSEEEIDDLIDSLYEEIEESLSSEDS